MALRCIYGGECVGSMRCFNETPALHCEICGKEIETIFKDKYGEVVGCDNCIEQIDPYE